MRNAQLPERRGTDVRERRERLLADVGVQPLPDRSPPNGRRARAAAARSKGALRLSIAALAWHACGMNGYKIWSDDQPAAFRMAPASAAVQPVAAPEPVGVGAAPAPSCLVCKIAGAMTPPAPGLALCSPHYIARLINEQATPLDQAVG